MSTPRILLVDDHLPTQHVTKRILMRAGWEVQTANDGAVALDEWQTATLSGRPFEVIIMDVCMPIMDGLTATRFLRRCGFKGPIIAFSASSTEPEKLLCLQAGCNAFIAKPTSAEKLLAVVRQQLEQRAAA